MHCKFNCITVGFDRKQHGIVIIYDFIRNSLHKYLSQFSHICALFRLHLEGGTSQQPFKSCLAFLRIGTKHRPLQGEGMAAISKIKICCLKGQFFRVISEACLFDRLAYPELSQGSNLDIKISAPGDSKSQEKTRKKVITQAVNLH